MYVLRVQIYAYVYTCIFYLYVYVWSSLLRALVIYTQMYDIVLWVQIHTYVFYLSKVRWKLDTELNMLYRNFLAVLLYLTSLLVAK